MKLRRLSAICFAATLALIPMACARPGPETTPPPSSTTTTTVSPAPREGSQSGRTSVPPGTSPGTTLSSSTSPTTRPPTSTPVPIPPEPPPTDCELARLDLVETAFGAWLNSQIIPTTDAGNNFYFEVGNNQFNPCSELSWVTLEGQNTNQEAALSTVLFFNYEELISDPLPIQFPAVGVERINDSALEVSYSYLIAPRNPEKLPVHYRMEGARLLGDEQIPAQFDNNPRLDLSRADLPVEGDFRPFGNAIYRPWDQELPVRKQYTIMMGESRINCDFPAFNGRQLSCYAEDSVPWPLLTPDFKAIPGESANLARMNFQAPWHVVTSLVEPPQVGGEHELLPAEATIQVGDFFIRTYGGAIIIHDVNWAYRLGEGIAEPVEVPSFQTDISRHPQNLIPWG